MIAAALTLPLVTYAGLSRFDILQTNGLTVGLGNITLNGITANTVPIVDGSNHLVSSGVSSASLSAAVSPLTTEGDIYYYTTGAGARLPIGSANKVMTTNGTDPAWALVVDANVSGSAAISRSKVASGSANHVVINDGSGNLSSEAQLAVSRGGTGLSSGTSGGVLAFTASGTLASSGALTASQLVLGGGAGVAPSSLAAGTQYQVLTMGASNPGYGALNLGQSAAITGTLPVANGGTNLASGTSGGVLAFTASGTLASSGALTASQLVIGGGAGAAPSSLAAGSQYQVLTMGASNPGYGAVNLGQSAAITGTLPIGNGGTGQTTAQAAIDALLPAQGSANGKFLTSNGSASSWGTPGASSAVPQYNYLVNGEFRLDQRNTGGAGTLLALAQGAYGPDQWYMIDSASGAANEYQRQSVATTSVGGYYTNYMIQLVNRNVGSKQIMLCQPIPFTETVKMRGRSMTFSYYADSPNGAMNLRACLGEWTGTADSITRNLVSSWASTPTWIGSFACDNTPADIAAGNNSWAQQSVTATVSTSANNVIVCIWDPTALSSANTFYISQAQLIDGSSALAWPIIQKSLAQDLHEAERFYEKSYDPETAPGTATTAGMFTFGAGAAINTNYQASTSFKVPKRGNPSITFYDGAGTSSKFSAWSAANSRTDAKTGSATTQNAGLGSFSFNGSDSSTTYTSYGIHWTADAAL